MSTPKTIVAHIRTPGYQWLVIPGRNPYIYIPAPNKAQANSIAASVDDGTSHPETYIHHLVTDGIRAALSLPRPLPPNLARLGGHEAWQPVSHEMWAHEAERGEVVTAVVNIKHPGQDEQAVHLIARPCGTRTITITRLPAEGKPDA